MVLITARADALFVWRRSNKPDMAGKSGVCCSVFRNEGHYQSSALIAEAVELAQKRWPGQRLFTYVNAGRIRSTNPGCCFRKAGWQRCGLTKGGLIILEKHKGKDADKQGTI